MAARMETRKDYIMLTQLEARIYLAEQLPERILVSAKTSYHREGIFWIGKYDENNHYLYVRETEWQQIALWVIQKLPLQKKTILAKKLIELFGDYGAIFREYHEIATAMKESGL